MNKKKRNTIFILISLVLIFGVLIVLSANAKGNFRSFYKAVSSPVVKIQKAFSSLGTDISNKIEYLKHYDEIKEELNALEKENQELKNDKAENEILKAENEELRQLLNLREYYEDYELVGGNVIAEDIADWYNEFTIDVGTERGVQKGNPVITGKGLVGIISVVGPDSAKVMTVADEQNVIMARIQRSNELVRVCGVSTENYTYEMKLDRIASTADLYVGDVIVTAESGGVYPKGITIGTVYEVHVNEITGERTATVIPAASLKGISEVIVMANKS